ncbi:mandelate racemase/muconate lactonizing enzyme family protein [Novosphingobium sp. JCM 18896]|uniref:mandelate racemase/muconate lactonizing enzyme family protein n=1 Tax=Novosphingobium sp. JCM 18896 TaxID=2989731 RepID=UPI002223E568|nr:mandelate racemase/muconate lactonizing enzyme family protein [Novosphingobium sp. JCM 18896]MCW1432275.1 mandelate racemase/muconate lactonizing enzyme family protein [Novosphingobium sp. JCM 18896]
MKVAAIDAVPFRIPLLHPVKFAVGEIGHLEHILVRIRSGEGLEGWAEAPARQMIYGETIKSMVAAIEDHFAPALRGLDFHNVEEAWHRMERLPGNHCAKAGVDMALHDLIAKAAGLPLRQLLGGYSRSIEVCHILGTGAPAEVAAQAADLRGRFGLRWFKLKGGMDPRGDTAMIAAVRDALGSDAQLTVDCNQAYPAHIAERLVEEWDRFDLAWIEEPCAGADPQGRGRVARACRTPLMLDESAFLPRDVAAEAMLGNCRIAAVKMARTGITKSRKVLALAEVHGMRTVVGGQAESELGAMFGAHFAAAHRATAQSAAELSFFLDATERITTESLQIVDGKITLPDQPGIGLDLDEDRLRRCLM